MLACIACTTKEGGGEDTGARGEATSSGGSSSKDAAKSLSSQIKDLALKLSGLQCKGGAAASASYRYKSRYNHHGAYNDDVASEGGGSHYAYLRAESSSSTPAWDFTSVKPGGGGGGGKAKVVQEDVVTEESNGAPKEWTALVEPGVQITFVSLPSGAGNDLKRIRFSREMFNKWQAQRWWGENFDRIMELYNVQRFSRQALPTPPRSDDGERESAYSRVGSTRESPYGNNRAPSTSSSRDGGGYFPSVPDPTEHILPHHLFHHQNPAGVGAGTASASGVRIENVSIDASRTTTSSRDEVASVSVSNASDAEVSEWVEQDEPGVYITIRELPDGNRELRRVRFSRERFGEVHAKLWWEDNRERIQAQYL